jgi:carbamoyl-phosphate synthase large subunit
MAKALKVVGLMNTQFAVKGNDIYVLEVNPRASRTVPFVSKVTGAPLAKIAARCMAGKSLVEQGFTQEIVPDYFSVKEAVFPFIKFPGVDPILGPEMKSTGEVMGAGDSFGEAFAKATLAASTLIPKGGNAFLSVRSADRDRLPGIALGLQKHGFKIWATRGTAKSLIEAGVEDVSIVNKVTEGRPNVVDMIKNDEIDLIVNTSEGAMSIADSFEIRREALMHKVTYTTTLSGARAMVLSMAHNPVETVRSVQELHAQLGGA